MFSPCVRILNQSVNHAWKITELSSKLDLPQLCKPWTYPKTFQVLPAAYWKVKRAFSVRLWRIAGFILPPYIGGEDWKVDTNEWIVFSVIKANGSTIIWDTPRSFCRGDYFQYTSLWLIFVVMLVCNMRWIIMPLSCKIVTVDSSTKFAIKYTYKYVCLWEWQWTESASRNHSWDDAIAYDLSMNYEITCPGEWRYWWLRVRKRRINYANPILRAIHCAAHQLSTCHSY